MILHDLYRGNVLSHRQTIPHRIECRPPVQTFRMDEEWKRLLTEIETLRLHLHELAKRRSFESPDMLDISRKLDRLIQEYNRLRNEKEK
jgi:hypothetical protein